MKSVEAQGGRGKKQLNALNLQGIQLISMSRQEGETRKGKRRVYRMWIGRLWTCDGWSRGMEETWMGQPGWLQATRWSGGNTCRSARSWGGSSSRDSPSTSSAIGGERRQQAWGFTSSVFPYPPLSHSLFVALFSGVSSLLRLQDRIEMKLQTTKRLH